MKNLFKLLILLVFADPSAGQDAFDRKQIWDASVFPRTTSEVPELSGYFALLHKNPKQLLALLGLDTTEQSIDISLLKLTAYYFLYDAPQGKAQIERLKPSLAHMTPIQEIRFLIYAAAIDSIESSTPDIIQRFETAVTKAHELSLPEEELSALNELAALYSNTNESHISIDYAMRANALAQATGRDDLKGYALAVLTSVQAHIGRHAQAIEAGEEATRIFRKLGYDYHLEFALYYLGNTLGASGNRDRAYKVLMETMDIAKRIGDDTTYFYAMSDVGSILLKQNQLKRALVYFEECAQYYAKIQDLAQYLANMEDLIKLLHSEGRRDQAESYLMRAQRWIDSMENKDKMQKMELSLLDLWAAHYERFGPGHKYLAILKEQVRLRDERFVGIERISVAKTSAQHELELKEEQNRLLGQVNDMQANAISDLTRIRNLFIFSILITTTLIVVLRQTIKQSRRIQEQKRELDQIMDNIKEGILKFGADYRIHEEHSLCADTILSTKGQKLGGQFLDKVLLRFGENGRLLWDQTTSVLSAMWQESSIAWDLNCGNLPQKVQLGNSLLQLSWHPVFQNDLLQEMMLVVADITELEEVRQKNSHILKLTQLVSVSFQRALAFLDTMDRELNGLSKTSFATTDPLMRQMHTWKGNSRTLGLHDLSQVIHDAETRLRENPEAVEAIQRIEEELKAYGSHASLFQRDNRSLSHWEPLEFLVKDLKKYVEGKGLRFQSWTIHDAIIDWAPQRSQIFHDLATHILTNAIEHGFIIPALNKPIALSVETFSTDQTEDWIFRDNGAGINWKKVEEIAQKRGFLAKAGRPLTDVLFLDQTSTATVVTERSGRGVGMAAVKDRVEALGGTVTLLDNEREPGAKVQITLPFAS